MPDSAQKSNNNNIWGTNNSTSFGNYRPYQRPDYSKFTSFSAFPTERSDAFFSNPQQQVHKQPTAGDFFHDIDNQNTKQEEDWAQTFQETRKAEEELNDQYNKEFWDRLQDEWKKLSEEGDKDHPWIHDFSDYYDPYKEYKFDDNNPMLDLENALEKGKAFLENGDIPSAVLCFESAVKQEPENAEAWELLGTSQAENEKDPNAIAALKRALELNPNNLGCLLSLAISYTNESYQNLALKMLNQWLQSNPKYSDLVKIEDNASGGIDEMTTSRIRGMELEHTQELFLKAVQKNAMTGNLDQDVQESLGVLFNLSGDYDKAVDCFKTAVEISPTNAKLWNRLGASYANGNRPTEAVGAYQRALDIQPGFIRARYNVGVVCINLKSYKEAAEHLLLAINHQATSKQRAGINIDNVQNQMSDTLWSTLRMTISLMGKHNLQDYIDKRDLKSLNDEFGMQG
jgi:peroxin-5